MIVCFGQTVLCFYGRSQRLKGALMRLTTQEGDMWRVDVAVTAGGSVLEARIVPPGWWDPPEMWGDISRTVFVGGA